ncbi:putative transcription factor C2H2 family [Arabidopsis thaliana]|uniref:RING-type E3 ubiquitin transferase n=1 Tax=Arabidopsis thaliana TaxID=3702 RepID=A0A178V482_ARATH|nr:hypothetical protein AXX17_AT4G13670 [Arabidopsis thaliana]
MNDRIPKPVVSVQVQAERVSRSPSQGNTNSIFLIVNTIKDEILINPGTGHRTVTSTPLSYKSLPINYTLPSCSHHHIQSLLHDRLHRDDHWLCDHLVPKISSAISSGFVDLTVSVAVTYKYVRVDEAALKISRMVLQGFMSVEETKSLNAESCSICLQSLVSSSKTAPTRMSCSHVFHNGCLVEWLNRKNTCPMFHMQLIDSSMFSSTDYTAYIVEHCKRHDFSSSGSTHVRSRYINICRSTHGHIRKLLHNQFLSTISNPWRSLCDFLSPKISTEFINLGFGRNGFTLTMDAKVTYRTVSVTSNDEKSLRTILVGKIKAEELKSLKIETERCSICLESLVSGPKPIGLTRMPCFIY